MAVANISLPAGAWDSHVHVIDEQRYPFHKDHSYRPKTASLKQLRQFEKELTVDNVCLVAVSIYGNNNDSIMDSLAVLKGRGRAVVTIDPETISDLELDAMHKAGVRGVRLNFNTSKTVCTKAELENRLFSHADKIRRLHWIVQLYISLEKVALIAECIPQLGVAVVLDHMASPLPDRPAKEQSGYKELIDLLHHGLIWIKISGCYRFGQLPDLDEYGRTLIRTNRNRVVWASDWPHTGGTERNIDGNRHLLQDYRDVDDNAFIRQCFEWCDFEVDTIQRLFVSNPHQLWCSGGQDLVPDTSSMQSQ